MSKKGTMALLAASAALFAVSVQSAAMAQAGTIRELDLNGDGTITKAEAQTALEAQFRKMDADHNGVLSEDEFVNSRLAILHSLDSDGDGQITRSELRSAFMARRGL